MKVIPISGLKKVVGGIGGGDGDDSNSRAIRFSLSGSGGGTEPPLKL
ncbi:hypothetical protein N473_01505 [Pseudoalteromonas luteoviolacea CPMOR-1]|uniref:Uncharacterized protein n=1 Tax=Pseudoalteromonas luteoviolacea CPMOR-1 TaxID=1365248 RepID=A0A162B281_9GAMM|nr:hypothetical protein [Pseudoalteromonas luteoviolacea]KZN65273.1 hypothetical protein N473_01505 [Pseudoalteromonas luteoviolacea CPMOR-1]